MAQVLAEQPDQLTVNEWTVYSKLLRYKKPIKTKHLSKHVKMDRPETVRVLNSLKDKSLIYWHVPQRFDDRQYYGWRVCSR